jgi:hypothetical protein
MMRTMMFTPVARVNFDFSHAHPGKYLRVHQSTEERLDLFIHWVCLSGLAAKGDIEWVAGQLDGLSEMWEDGKGGCADVASLLGTLQAGCMSALITPRLLEAAVPVFEGADDPEEALSVLEDVPELNGDAALIDGLVVRLSDRISAGLADAVKDGKWGRLSEAVESARSASAAYGLSVDDDLLLSATRMLAAMDEEEDLQVSEHRIYTAPQSSTTDPIDDMFSRFR